MNGEDTPVVRLDEVEIAFGGLRAIDGVTLTIEPGERRGVIGPNGAGKTTLLNLISGVLKPRSGSIRLLGVDATHLPARARARLGIRRTYQVTNLLESLSVLENVYIAVQGVRRKKWSVTHPAQRSGEVLGRAEEVVDKSGLWARADDLVQDLSHGEKRQLEFALALSVEPRVLLLDEPMAGLSPAERATMRSLIEQIPGEVTIVLIEHNMEVVMEATESITVLHHGKVVAEGTPTEIRADETVQRVYLGARASESAVSHGRVRDPRMDAMRSRRPE